MAENMTLKEISEAMYSRQRSLFTTELLQTTCCLDTNLPPYPQTFIPILNSQAISSCQHSLLYSETSLILRLIIYIFSVSV